MHGIFGLGAFQTLVFSILLFTKKEKKVADKYLAGFFLIITIYLSNIYSYAFGVWNKCPDIIFVITLVPLFYGPLLYFYVRSLIGLTLSKKELLIHFIPIICTYLIILPFLFHSEGEKLRYFTDKYMNLPVNVSLGTFLQHLSGPVYFVWIIFILKKHRQYLKDNHSSLDKINLDWMQRLLIGTISIWMIDTLYVVAVNFTPFAPSLVVSWGIKVVFLIFVLLIGFYGIKQGSIFVSIQQKPAEKETRFRDVVKKLVSDEESKKYIKILVEHMEKNKVFLNSELRIQEISVRLNIPVHILSYIINEKLNQNYYDFINTYRIKEAKSRLQDRRYNNLTILSLAYDCGFNSKSTFNRLFKMYTGFTPTQFRKQVK